MQEPNEWPARDDTNVPCTASPPDLVKTNFDVALERDVARLHGAGELLYADEVRNEARGLVSLRVFLGEESEKDATPAVRAPEVSARRDARSSRVGRRWAYREERTASLKERRLSSGSVERRCPRLCSGSAILVELLHNHLGLKERREELLDFKSC